MVKKIRVIEEAVEEPTASPENELMELAKTMDWKLWEILQILQRFEKKISVLDGAEAPDDTEETTTSTKK